MFACAAARLGGRSSLGTIRTSTGRARQRGTSVHVARWLTTSARRQQEQNRDGVTWGPPPAGTKVFACMSGGVDSSVAARLLLEQGYDVEPVFMRNWDSLDEQSGSGGCEWERDWEDVRRVCRENLGGLKPRLVDLSRDYWSHVFEPALEGWAAGVTPNPDVTCNQCALLLLSVEPWLRSLTRGASQAYQVSNTAGTTARSGSVCLDSDRSLGSPRSFPSRSLPACPFSLRQLRQGPVPLSLDISHHRPTTYALPPRRLLLEGRRARPRAKMGHAHGREEGQHGYLLRRRAERVQRVPR